MSWTFLKAERTLGGMIRPEAPRPTHQRNLGARAAAAASAVFWGFFFFGLIDLFVPIDKTAGFYDSYLLETGWGLIYTFLVGAAFLSLTVRPSLTMPLVQVALVALCLGVTAIASGSLGQLVPAVLLVLNAYGVSYLARDRLRLAPRWYRPPVDPVLATFAILLLPPAVVFAVDMIAGYRTGRPPTGDDTWGLDHWPTQAALALAGCRRGLGGRGRCAWSLDRHWSLRGLCRSDRRLVRCRLGDLSDTCRQHRAAVGSRGARVGRCMGRRGWLEIGCPPGLAGQRAPRARVGTQATRESPRQWHGRRLL